LEETTVNDSCRDRNLDLPFGVTRLPTKLEQGRGRAPPGLGALAAAQTACKIVHESGRRMLEGCQIDIVRGLAREHWISSQGKPPLIAWSIVGEGSIGSPSLCRLPETQIIEVWRGG
jgi:hypothetical protein